MIEAYVRANTWFTCKFSGEREKLIREYAEKNGVDLADAITALRYTNDNFDIYDDSVESDFMTCEIESVEEAEE